MIWCIWSRLEVVIKANKMRLEKKKFTKLSLVNFLSSEMMAEKLSARTPISASVSVVREHFFCALRDETSWEIIYYFFVFFFFLFLINNWGRYNSFRWSFVVSCGTFFHLTDSLALFIRILVGFYSIYSALIWTDIRFHFVVVFFLFLLVYGAVMCVSNTVEKNGGCAPFIKNMKKEKTYFILFISSF